MENEKNIYLSSFSASGYQNLLKSSFRAYSDNIIYIIKGASSSIRSMFISQIKEQIKKEGYFCDTVLSPGSDAKIEGVIFNEIGLYIFDGTNENFFEELLDCNIFLINLGECVNRKEIFEKRELIFKHIKDKKLFEEKSKKYLSTVISMKNDIDRTVGKSLNAEKIERFVTRFVKKEFGTVGEKCGDAKYCYISAFSGEDTVTLFDTIRESCARIYIIDDKLNIVTNTLILQLKDAAVLCGYDVICCLDNISSKEIEHLIIPELSLCIFSSNIYHQWIGDYTKKINSIRFTDREIIKAHKNRVDFNIDAIEELLSQAKTNLHNANKEEKKIDEIYLQFLDKSKLENAVSKTTDEIFRQ